MFYFIQNLILFKIIFKIIFQNLKLFFFKKSVLFYSKFIQNLIIFKIIFKIIFSKFKIIFLKKCFILFKIYSNLILFKINYLI